VQRSISLARWAHSSKPAGAGFAAVAHAGTDERTPYRYIDPALHTIYGQCQIKAIQMRVFARTAAVSLIFRSPTWSIFRGVARTSIMRQRPSVFRRPTGCRGAASWCPAGWVVGPHGHRHAVRRRSITWAAACTGRRRFSELVLRTTGRRGEATT